MGERGRGHPGVASPAGALGGGNEPSEGAAGRRLCRSGCAAIPHLLLRFGAAGGREGAQ